MGKKKTLELLEKFKNFVNSNNSESESDGEIEATKPIKQEIVATPHVVGSMVPKKPIKIKETTKPTEPTEPNIQNIPDETPTEKKKRIQSEAQKLNTQKMREKLKEAHQKRAIEKEQARIEEQRIIDEKIIKKAIELKRKQLKKEKILDEEYVPKPESGSIPPKKPHIIVRREDLRKSASDFVDVSPYRDNPVPQKPSGLILNFKKK